MLSDGETETIAHSPCRGDLLRRERALSASGGKPEPGEVTVPEEDTPVDVAGVELLVLPTCALVQALRVKIEKVRIKVLLLGVSMVPSCVLSHFVMLPL